MNKRFFILLVLAIFMIAGMGTALAADDPRITYKYGPSPEGGDYVSINIPDTYIERNFEFLLDGEVFLEGNLGQELGDEPGYLMPFYYDDGESLSGKTVTLKIGGEEVKKFTIPGRPQLSLKAVDTGEGIKYILRGQIPPGTKVYYNQRLIYTFGTSSRNFHSGIVPYGNLRRYFSLDLTKSNEIKVTVTTPQGDQGDILKDSIRTSPIEAQWCLGSTKKQYGRNIRIGIYFGDPDWNGALIPLGEKAPASISLSFSIEGKEYKSIMNKNSIFSSTGYNTDMVKVLGKDYKKFKGIKEVKINLYQNGKIVDTSTMKYKF